jgi:hypothetical protein
MIQARINFVATLVAMAAIMYGFTLPIHAALYDPYTGKVLALADVVRPYVDKP